MEVGDRFTLTIGAIAHGGHFIAHAHDSTIFVRGAMEGELALVEITHYRRRVFFAHAVEILEPSRYRVKPPCSASVECGGCDFQFIGLDHQRVLKAQVVRESLIRFAGMGPVEAQELVGRSITGMDSGGDWRTRSRFVWQGGWSMRKVGSSELVATPECTVITPEMRDALSECSPDKTGEYFVVQGDHRVSIGQADIVLRGPASIRHKLFNVTWDLTPRIFWQAHYGVIDAISLFLSDHVNFDPSESWWDLYGGVGVFSAFLMDRVHHVTLVEGDRHAIAAARVAFSGVQDVTIRHADMGEFIGAHTADTAPFGVILDPPRSGLGTDLARALVNIAPQVLVYIACDPVALARDLKILTEHYSIEALNVVDAFPMTAHMESIAILRRIRPGADLS